MISSNTVYEILKKIPKGRVSTYGDIARAIGFPNHSRFIGRVLSKNSNLVVVPCHRVVTSEGKLGGYSLGSMKKKWLLEKEGIIINDNLCVQDFNKIRFRPVLN